MVLGYFEQAGQRLHWLAQIVRGIGEELGLVAVFLLGLEPQLLLGGDQRVGLGGKRLGRLLRLALGLREFAIGEDERVGLGLRFALRIGQLEVDRAQFRLAQEVAPRAALDVGGEEQAEDGEHDDVHKRRCEHLAPTAAAAEEAREFAGRCAVLSRDAAGCGRELSGALGCGDLLGLSCRLVRRRASGAGGVFRRHHRGDSGGNQRHSGRSDQQAQQRPRPHPQEAEHQQHHQQYP